MGIRNYIRAWYWAVIFGLVAFGAFIHGNTNASVWALGFAAVAALFAVVLHRRREIRKSTDGD
jgi:FtsH-binding integral membrane protein